MITVTVKSVLEQLVSGENLSAETVKDIFGRLTNGELSDPEIAAFLVGLACKGLTSEEIAAAASVMREKVMRVPLSVDAIDTCGTGGDGKSTFNVSTCAAIIAAGAGAYVAKHGNRTNTRVSGSAEALQSLGVNLDADAATVARCIEEAHVGFLFAIKYHPSMKYAAPVRKALAIKTIFNFVGPLTNPALVKRQIIGVPNPEETELVAGALKLLGTEKAMVIHGMERLCDISIAGPTQISEVSGGKVKTYTVTPEGLGLERSSLDAVMVGSPAESAERIRQILKGQKGPARDIAAINASAALVVAGMADDLQGGLKLACESIDSGGANDALTRLVEISNQT